MIRKMIKMLAFAVIAVMLVSCSDYPTELINAANEAVTDLSIVQPEVYATEVFANLNDSLTGAITIAEKQKSNWVFSNYGKVKDQLNGVISYAEVVKIQAIENKTNVEAEINSIMVNIRTLNDENAILITKAPRGKEGRAAVLAIQNDIATINVEYEFVKPQIETSKNLFEILDRVKAIEIKAVSINQELKDVISEIG
jgi:hypothetical protein